MTGSPLHPRIELHTHLEGSVTPRRLLDLAEKYGQPGVPAACLDSRGENFVFSGFAGFLDLFRQVTLLLRSAADFHAVALDLGEQLAADGVDYAEVTVSYGVMLKRGLAVGPIQAALAEAAQQVNETRGLQIRWIPDAVRQWGVDAAWRALEAALTAGREQGVVGFGLGGDEAAALPGSFAAVMAAARAEGLGVTIHAGEVPSMGDRALESVRQAVIVCGAERIGHGLAAAADSEVMALLAAGQVCVELCPGSNVRIGGLAKLMDHPLQEFLAAGIPCCLNTDDRSLLGLTLTGEFERARNELGLTLEQERRLAKAARVAIFEDFPDNDT